MQRTAPRFRPATTIGAAKSDGVDTSLLLEELKRTFQSSGEPVSVNFRALMHWIRAGDQFTHQIHPYPAKLLPHIARLFLDASILRRADKRVLDPFCGSGTVPLEASLTGHIPLAADSNPLGLLIAKVKTTPYATDELLSVADSLRRTISRLKTAPTIPIINDSLWYSKTTKKALEIVLRAVMKIENNDHRDFFRVCFSVTARRLSLADPNISVPVRLKRKPGLSEEQNRLISRRMKWVANTTASDEFQRVIQVNIGRVLTTNQAFKDRIPLISAGGDARCLKQADGTSLPESTIHLTITSPPYGSAQKYVRASSLSLNWLSLCSPDQLADLEGLSIGREHLASSRESGSKLVSDDVLALLNRIKKRNPFRERITRTYLSEMREALREVVRVTAEGGRIVIVVGNNTVCGLSLSNDKYMTRMMESMGVRLELALTDRIHSRGLLTSRNSIASPIGGETILMFRK